MSQVVAELGAKTSNKLIIRKTPYQVGIQFVSGQDDTGFDTPVSDYNVLYIGWEDAATLVKELVDFYKLRVTYDGVSVSPTPATPGRAAQAR